MRRSARIGRPCWISGWSLVVFVWLIFATRTLHSAQLADRYVSLDPITGDLRVPFKSDGVDHSFLVALPNHVIPQVSVSVEHRDNSYVYIYNIRNAPTARQPINQWYAIVDSSIRISAVGEPPPWFHEPIGMTSTNPNASTFVSTYVSTGALLLRWALKYGFVADRSSGVIFPGGSQNQFSITCDGRPGFITVFLRSFVDRFLDDPLYSLPLPRDVSDEALRYINSIEKSSVVRTVVGPAFAPSLTRAQIGASLLKQTQQLINKGGLSSGSGFVQDAIAFLKRLSTGEAVVKESVFSHSPESATEKDLAMVIQEDVSISR